MDGDTARGQLCPWPTRHSHLQLQSTAIVILRVISRNCSKFPISEEFNANLEQSVVVMLVCLGQVDKETASLKGPGLRGEKRRSLVRNQGGARGKGTGRLAC